MRRSAIAFLLSFLASSALGATFTVTSNADSGAGTLRQAILDANASAGADTIVFTATSVNATSSLPAITGPTTINGLIGTNGRVTINGVVFDCSRAFQFAPGSSGSTLTRVSVTNFCEGLRIDAGVANVTVTESFLGPASIAGDDNSLSNNDFGTLEIFGDRNQVLRNGINAVSLLFADGNRIGSSGNGNIVRLIVMQSSAGTIIEGNTIDRGFFPPLPGPAITVSNALPPAATGSTIRDNIIRGFGTGIGVSSGPPAAAAITISRNRISEVNIAIDLGVDGATANDPAPDADTGANNLQNFPVLTSAIAGGSQVTVSGTLASTPLTSYRIEVFSSSPADSEPSTFLGTFDITTDATGNATFAQSLTTPLATDVVMATATNLTTGDTSEVSAPIAVDAPGQIAFATTTLTVNESAGNATLTVTRADGTEGTVTVAFTTENGTATAPSDYQTTSGTLTFGPGVTSQSIVVPIVSDAVPELAETFTVRLSNPTGGATLGASTATVTIAAAADAQAVPTLSVWSLLALATALAAVVLLRMR
jgi:Calx-beta domain